MQIMMKLIFLFCLLFSRSLQATLPWTTPIEISTPGEESSSPQIVVDPIGNITAAWNVKYTGYRGAVAVTKPLAGIWTLPINISPTNENALMLSLNGNSNGDTIAIWSSHHTIGTATKRFNENWQLADTIPADKKIFNVESVIDQAGNETAIWIKRSFLGLASTVQSSTKPAGGNWQDKPDTISPPLTTVNNLHLVVDQVGNATAIWEAGDIFATAIFTSYKPFGGVWDGPIMLTDLDPPAFQPQIAVDPQGNLTAIWSEGYCDLKLRSAYKTFESNWSQTETVFYLKHRATFNPQLAVDGNGNATAVWQLQDNCFNSIIQSAFKPFQGTWQTIPDQLSTGQSAVIPSLAVNAKGDATVAWRLNDDNLSVIQASSKPFGENWQTTPDTLSSPLLSCVAPQVVMNPIGSALVVWQAQDECNVFIQASEQLIPLAVNAITPDFGSTLGGTEVSLTGTGFTTVSTVSFGDVPATSFTINSDTSITAIAPPHAAGLVDITVANAIETSAISLADKYTYIEPPTVIYVSPDTGPTVGGIETFIKGTSFTTATSVSFGNVPALSFTILSDTSITAIAPPQEPGVVNIIVTNKVGSTHQPITQALMATGITPDLTPIVIDHFTYLQSVIPHLNHLTPNFGLISGGTSVEIQGSRFTTTTAVFFGDQPATSFVVNSDTSITAIAPAHAAGTVSVVVTTLFGSTSETPESFYSYLKDLFVPVVPPIPPIPPTPPIPPVPPVPPTPFPIPTPLPPLNILLPPKNVRGHQKANKFLTQTEFVNIIKWDPPSEGTSPVTYYIYRDAHLNKRIGVVQSKHNLQFEDRHRKRGRDYTYFIVSVDEAGLQSAPVSVVVRSLK